MLASTVFKKALRKWTGKRFCTGYFGKDELGYELELENVAEGEATTVCLGGAVAEAADGVLLTTYGEFSYDRFGLLENYLHNACRQLAPEEGWEPSGGYVDVNDDLGFRTARKVLRRALRLALEDEAAGRGLVL